MPGRLTIGLYNSYDARKFHEAHRRALVRAAPLALAYGANLCTFGFPYQDLADNGGKVAENRGKGAEARRGEAAAGETVSLRTPVDVARYVAGSTSVEGGQHFVDLAEKGRFNVFDLPEKGFPPQLGTPVLTTEHAKCPKDTSARQVARDLVDGRSQLLIFGLGPTGTPPEVRQMCQWELDITSGQNIGLETATALGAVVAAIYAHVEAIEAAPRRPPHRA
ncbi:MAG TPA: DUF531 family protein [Candidatus Thermoplasmatota archaeon]|nr:DUF531 family protein [Candidatus Thermoplasmatota archaeon]